MKSFHGNRYVDALIKTLLLLVIIHIILILIGFFGATTVGFAGLKVFWPHLTSGIAGQLTSLVVAAAVYFGIWRYFTK